MNDSTLSGLSNFKMVMNIAEKQVICNQRDMLDASQSCGTKDKVKPAKGGLW